MNYTENQIKELTEILDKNYKKTLTKRIRYYLQELRDIKLQEIQQPQNNYYPQYRHIEYINNNGDELPNITFDVEIKHLNGSWFVCLGTFNHHWIYNNSLFYFIYIEDKNTKKRYFTRSNDYHGLYLFNQDQSLKTDIQTHYYLDNKRISDLCYHWYELCNWGSVKPKQIFYNINEQTIRGWWGSDLYRLIYENN